MGVHRSRREVLGPQARGDPRRVALEDPRRVALEDPRRVALEDPRRVALEDRWLQGDPCAALQVVELELLPVLIDLRYQARAGVLERCRDTRRWALVRAASLEGLQAE